MDETEQQATHQAGKPFLSSSEVVDQLGISKATLYAYVSRGLIRSEPVPDAPRTRRYRADDVERLLQRQRMRTDPETTTASALDWGTPVLESDVSLISEQRLYYRGQDAVSLAKGNSFEAVTALLCLGDLNAELPAPSNRATERRKHATVYARQMLVTLEPLGRVQTLLPVLERAEPATYDVRPETTMRIGIDILRLMVESLIGAEGHSGVARTLQAYWAPGKSQFVPLLDAALILSADHELNVSTFTVRCIASAGAPLHAAIAGGLAALRGHKHGGATLQAEAMVREVPSPEQALDTLRDRLRRGDSIAGFGHRLYSNGDPRGIALLEMMRHANVDNETLRLSDAICHAVDELQGLKPNLEFALVMLCRAMGQPSGTAISLMALGRTAGWIAHAREEYERDQLIRPRARYGGALPVE